MLFGGKFGEVGKRGAQLGLVIGMVGELPRTVVHIGLHIEMAVAAQVEQYRAPNALGFAAQRFVDRAAHSVVGLGSRQDALGAGELYACLEAAVLR